MREAGRKKRRLWFKIFIGHLIVSALWAAIRLAAGVDAAGNVPGDTPCSPPRRYAVQRSPLKLEGHGGAEKYGKMFRPSRRVDAIGEGWFGTFLSPGGLFGPIVHYFAGWDVYADDICVEGIAMSMKVSDDDGDVGFTLKLPPSQAKYAWRRNHIEDVPDRDRIIVEIDEPQRKNFPVVYDMAPGDRLKVCGRWVYDRGHDHNEVHPARWVEILEENAERVPSH
jgi:hypothetical protein